MSEKQEKPKVTDEFIAELMKRVQYCCHHVEGTTAVVATGFLDGEYALASETAACLYSEDFDPEMGKQIAIAKCEQACIRQLWELEGYFIYKSNRFKKILEARQAIEQHNAKH